ncbi:MAG: VWA domain-containing protein, partial [Gammaproteobacteria bacterium]
MSHMRYDLSDHKLRARALKKFFEAQGMHSDFMNIESRESWFELELAAADTTIHSPELLQLGLQINQTCGTRLPVKEVSLQSVLRDVIKEAGTDNVFNKTACNAVLGTCFSFNDLGFDGETGQLSVSMPTAAIVPMFSSLEHDLLRVSDTQLGIFLYQYLSAQPNAIFFVNMGHNTPPKLFLNQNFFPKEQLILHEEPQEDGSIKITPYMRVTIPSTPPDYHFMLDRSSSMDGERLYTAKKSLLSFAQILFRFAPDTKLFINYFNEESCLLGRRAFLLNDLQNGTLKREINAINATGGTNIAGASRQKIRECIDKQTQNNILLFTDGQDEKHDHEALAEDLKTLTPEQKIRNKYFIISLVEQPEVLYTLTQTFGSGFFIAATTELEKILEKHGELQNWAAARDLFTTRIQVQQNLNNEIVGSSHTSVMMQSNQVEELPSFIVQPGDNVKIEVFDSFNNVLVSTQKIIGPGPIRARTPDRPRSPAQNSLFHHDETGLARQVGQ